MKDDKAIKVGTKKFRVRKKCGKRRQAVPTPVFKMILYKTRRVIIMMILEKLGRYFYII